MTIHTYICIVGDEASIQRIHKEARVPNSRVKRLKARRDARGEDNWWDWGTEPIVLDKADPDDEIKAMLQRHQPIFQVIARHAADVDVYLEIIVRYSEGDDPRGIHLSAETVHLVSALGGAVDIDVVPLSEK